MGAPAGSATDASSSPGSRRECFGELIEVDGCDHRWFEDRAPACTLLVFM